MSSSRDARRRGGFTLLELIVVLSILAGLLAVVAPSLSGGLESGRMRAAASDIRSTLAHARTLAVGRSRTRMVTFDLDKRTFGVDNAVAPRALPETVRIVVRKASGEATGGAVNVRFFPDGCAEEAEIALTSEGGGTLRVTVDPLTGIAESGGT